MYDKSLEASDLGTTQEATRTVLQELEYDVFEDQAPDIVDAISYLQGSNTLEVHTEPPDNSLELLYLVLYHSYRTDFGKFKVKFPPMQSLVLKCNQPPARYEFVNLLDFSRLRTLILLDVRADLLLTKVHVTKFSQIRVLHFTMSQYHPLDMNIASATNALHRLFDNLSHLERLGVSYHGSLYDFTPVTAIVKVGQALRKISLRRSRACEKQQPTGDDLKLLLAPCPNITALTLDLYLHDAEVS